jgi:thiol-disulfide isomerase/thioredoxin
MKTMLVGLLLGLVLTHAAPAQVAKREQKFSSLLLEGQIVCCEDCWTRADRTTTAYGTPADLANAAECIANGDPTLLAVMDKTGATTFYQLEEGKFKKPGKTWLELVGSRVEISGATRSRRGKQVLRVDELKVLATPQQREQEVSFPVIAPQPNVIGTEAELALKDLFGAEQKLSAFRGRIVVLNFWATYCGPCRKEMPDLAAIQNQYAALGVQVIGASADTLAEQKEVLAFIKEVKVNFPIWLGATTEDMSRFGLGPGLPGTAVIGRDGKIVATFGGLVKEAELKKQLDTLIASSQKEARKEIAAAKAQSREASSVPS